MSKRSGVTAQMMDDLLELALHGNEGAENEYRALASKMAHRVNQQIRTAEKEDLKGNAYRRVERFLSQYDGDKVRFAEGNKRFDLLELSDQVDQMMMFQNVKDYSISYLREATEQIEDVSSAMSAAGVDITDDEIVFEINEMFKTDAWKEYKKSHGRSTDLIQAAEDAFKQGKTVQDLIDAYNDFKITRKTDLASSWTQFSGKLW